METGPCPCSCAQALARKHVLEGTLQDAGHPLAVRHSRAILCFQRAYLRIERVNYLYSVLSLGGGGEAGELLAVLLQL